MTRDADDPATPAGEGSAPASPRVTAIAWGRIEVEGADGPFKDAKLYPGGAREWDWGETGTRHVPGVQVADARELVERGARAVVLSRGVQERLRVPSETVEWLESRGVRVEVLPTPAAVERYNELAVDEPAGALLHSTC